MSFTGDVVLIEGQSGGSIVGITPGLFFVFSQNSTDFKYLVLGAALEKKSVRDMAAGLNRLGGMCSIFLLFIYLNFDLA